MPLSNIHKMATDIQLGDIVQCIYTGFKGVVVSKTEYINGCIQFAVIPKVGKENKNPEEVYIDSQSLNLIKKGQNNNEEYPTGGPNHKAIRQRGF